MPILVKSDDVRGGRKAKARGHGWLRLARESMGYWPFLAEYQMDVQDSFVPNQWNIHACFSQSTEL